MYIGLNQDFPSASMHVRFAFAGFNWIMTPFNFTVTSYGPNDQELDSIRVGTFDGTLMEGYVCPNYEDPDYISCWYLYDLYLDAPNDVGGYLKIEPDRTVLGYTGQVHISGLYVSDINDGFPGDLCSYVLPTPTPSRTPSNTPLPTPTGTITQTWTPTASPTAGATASGPTATPSQTPVPYVTRTPTNSPTPWQSPMATLAGWQITPDASITPLATPTVYDPLPTWRPFPTLSFPTIETVTRYPTITPEEITPTPLATSTPFSITMVPMNIYTMTEQLDTLLNFEQIYDAGYSMSNSVAGPFRIIRGTIRNYLPSLASLFDSIVIMLFIIAAVYGIKLLLAIGGAIIKIIEVVLEFIPL